MLATGKLTARGTPAEIMTPEALTVMAHPLNRPASPSNDRKPKSYTDQHRSVDELV